MVEKIASTDPMKLHAVSIIIILLEPLLLSYKFKGKIDSSITMCLHSISDVLSTEFEVSQFSQVSLFSVSIQKQP